MKNYFLMMFLLLVHVNTNLSHENLQEFLRQFNYYAFNETEYAQPPLKLYTNVTEVCRMHRDLDEQIRQHKAENKVLREIIEQAGFCSFHKKSLLLAHVCYVAFGYVVGTKKKGSS